MRRVVRRRLGERRGTPVFSTVRFVHPPVNDERIEAESTVSGIRTNVPARIRRELGIEDGDRLRWSLRDDGSIRVEVVRRGTGTFTEFEGYDGARPTDVATDHDAWGVE